MTVTVAVQRYGVGTSLSAVHAGAVELRWYTSYGMRAWDDSCLSRLTRAPGPAQAQMVRELGAIVRNQVPAARPSVLSAYGEVLFRAARDASGACAYEVEALVQV